MKEEIKIETQNVEYLIDNLRPYLEENFDNIPKGEWVDVELKFKLKIN